MLAITSDRLIRGMAGRHRELEIMPRTSTPPRQPRCSWSPAGRPPAGRSCSRPSNGRASPRRASAASICWGSCASGVCWCRGRWPATSSWSWPSTTGSPSRGPWTVRTASPSGCCATSAATAPPRNVTFAWWSGIPLTEVRAALARVKDQLVELEFEGTSYWLSAGDGRAARRRRPRAAHGAGAAGVRRIPARLRGPVPRAAAGACRQDRPRRQRRVQEDHRGRRRRDRHLGRAAGRAGEPASCPNPSTRLTGCGLPPKSPLSCRPRSTADSLAPERVRRRP